MSFATPDALNALMPHILSAPKDRAAIDCLCFRPDFNERTFPDALEVTVEEGVVGERWTKFPWLKTEDGQADPAIQISILSSRVWDAVRISEEMIHPGDTILADFDTSEANCPTGTRLQVGTATLRVSGVFNEGCVKWQARYGKEARTWLTLPEHRPLRLRGILCSVQTAGRITAHDSIVKL